MFYVPNKFYLLPFLFCLHCSVYGQRFVLYIPHQAFKVIDTSGLTVDTICTLKHSGNPYKYEAPAYCQNDTAFFVCNILPSNLTTLFTLAGYSKNAPCDFIDSYTYPEKNKLIWRKTTVYSNDNKIMIDYNDCDSTINLLSFDPYLMDLKDARKQLLENIRKIYNR